MLPQHSAKTVEHYTPPEYIEAAREVMGGIHLDPATTVEVNTALVRADSFHTEFENGLMLPWYGNVWLNPPGGVDREDPIKSTAARWWAKLVEKYEAHRVKQAIFLGFTLEILRSTQHPLIARSVIEFPCCFPKSRIDFLKRVNDPLGVSFVKQGSPSHANVLAYLPDRDDHWAIQRFADTFAKFGVVR